MTIGLRPFFSPRGVALVGASANPGKLSHGILRNLVQGDYQGAVHPVNPRYNEILDMPCYAELAEVPDPVDLAIIILPALATPDILEACGQRGIAAATVISGGFRETGPEGAALEEQCVSIAHRYGMRLLGPNCVGTIDLYTGLNTSFIRGLPARGHIGFLSQSGAIGGGVIDYVRGKGVGFSCFVSLGNEADVTEAALLEYLSEDPNTHVIAAYLEGVADGRHFMQVAEKVTRRKPVVVLKVGHTDAGARAVSSHTGSLAGSREAYTAAFSQSGVLVVDTIAELFDVALALSNQPLPRGDRVAVLTNAGGPAVLAADSLAQHGMRVSALSPETEASLRQNLMPGAQVGNPVDMLGGADVADYGAALRTLLADDAVDGALAILVPQVLVDPAAVAATIGDVAGSSEKPVLACFMGDASVGEARQELHARHVPMYVFPEDAGRAFGAMRRYRRWLDRAPEALPALPGLDHDAARQALDGAKDRRFLGEATTRPLLQAYGIPIVSGGVACTPDEAVAVARDVGYPVALKLISPDVLHKSAAGGVRLGLGDAAAVEAACQEIVAGVSGVHPDAAVDGFLVEKMAPPGHEIIVGVKRDPQFGPLVMVGLGGIYVELLTDVAFGIAPLNRRQARALIDTTKAGRLLAGLHDQEPANIEAVIDCMLRLGQLALDFPEIEEVEVNPLCVQAQGVLALDARAILKE